jgi:hypothetical protein
METLMALCEVKVAIPIDKTTEKQLLLIYDEQKHLTELSYF